ncbi:MAG: hypothetical protein LBU15_01120 [Rickettsiales bacterium]|jgi:hypothetical protein|nr:hypothetical protein [Rickettsiales bacterium]
MIDTNNARKSELLSSLVDELELNLREVKRGIGEIDVRGKVHQASLEAKRIAETVRQRKFGEGGLPRGI